MGLYISRLAFNEIWEYITAFKYVLDAASMHILHISASIQTYKKVNKAVRKNNYINLRWGWTNNIWHQQPNTWEAFSPLFPFLHARLYGLLHLITYI